MDASLDVSAVVEAETSAYNCQECGYSTEDKSNFRRHKNTVHKKKGPATSTPIKGGKPTSWMCDFCGKAYSTGYSLKLHVKNKHTLDFKHTCGVCGKGFNQSIQYRFHVAVHAKLVLHNCKFCKTEFSGHSSLSRHLDICPAKDTNKPYVCDMCQASFSKKYKKDEHFKGKHGPPTYQCSCGKRFQWRSSLRVHSNICKNKNT